MKLDLNQLHQQVAAGLEQGVQAARRLPAWAWYVPIALIGGVAWGVALFGPQGVRDQPAVTVRDVPRHRSPEAAVAGERIEVSADEVQAMSRPRRPRPRRHRHAAPAASARQAAPRDSSPTASPIGPEANWIETVSTPGEVGALRRRPEPAGDAGGGGTASTGEKSGAGGQAGSGEKESAGGQAGAGGSDGAAGADR